MSDPGTTADAPAGKPASSRKRRARPSLARKQLATAQREAAKRQRILQREADQQRTIDEAKAAIQALIDQDEQRRLAQAASQRPASVVELCRELGVPADIHYHPRYNLLGVAPSMDIQRVEAIAFGRDWPAAYGGLGAFLHLQQFIQMTWPTLQWNPWLERMLRALCDTEHEVQIGQCRMRFVNFVGAGSSGKTFAAGLFACAWFMVDLASGFEPRSSVTLTSTSKGIIAQRVWPVIQKLYHEAVLHPSGEKLKWGHMIDSQKVVCGMSLDPSQERKRDMKHSICALAVETGELQGALDKIKGRHTERMMLIVDEANSTPQAIFECIPNMLTSARELIVLVIGNAGSRLDPHGQCCEPRHGWKSITIEDEQWETRGVAKWGIGPGICLHFDAAKSPNVLAGRTEHKHIYSFERWQQVLRMGDEYRNTLQHWSQDRGFWPPDGLQSTIFTDAMIVNHDGCGRFSWLSSPRDLASLDPAFGGDNCVLLHGRLGSIDGGRLGIELLERLLVPFDPSSPDDIQIQIARFVIAKCLEWKVEPPCFGGDSTGSGRGVIGFIQQLWSPHIHAIEFGGAASDLPASMDDPRKSCEIYTNRVTELWYVSRDVLVSEQLKGLYLEASQDFCKREYKFVSRRYKVETKEDMKLRIGHSPDDGDAVVVMVDVARRNGLVPGGLVGATGRARGQDSWTSVQRELASLAGSDYSEGTDFRTYADLAV